MGFPRLPNLEAFCTFVHKSDKHVCVGSRLGEDSGGPPQSFREQGVVSQAPLRGLWDTQAIA